MSLKSLVPLSMILIASASHAQNAAPAAGSAECKPNYEVKYAACASPSHGTEVKEVTRENVLVVKGAKDVFIGQCNDGIPALAAEYPGAKNFVVTGWHADDNPSRGYYDFPPKSKKDVLCSFQFEAPVAKVAADSACAIEGVAQTSTCYTKVETADVDTCLASRPKDMAGYFVKAACLLDANSSPTVAMDVGPEKYSAIQFQLKVLNDYAAKYISNPELKRLHDMLNTK